MHNELVIIGGGLAGLSAGCYALASGFRVTIVEHNLTLGGVCNAWRRGDYTIDGCIHWLTGGAFGRLYEELGIVPDVELRTIEQFATYEHAADGIKIPLGRDLQAFAKACKRISPDDAEEIDRLVRAASDATAMAPPVDRPPELNSLRDTFASLWQMRNKVGTLAHYRDSIDAWTKRHLVSPALRRLFCRLLPDASAPTTMLLFLLGYLQAGWLSRPVGGTARFRDALVGTYKRLGGKARLHHTVDEILVDGDTVVGVRLEDGSMIGADFVIATSSTPETIQRLLGGRFGAVDLRRRMDEWKMFSPIVLASFGVSKSLSLTPQQLVLDGLPPFEVGGVHNTSLSIRIYNDDPTFAPEGHTVVQAMVPTSYDWWATRGEDYQREKDLAAATILERIQARFPAIGGHVRITDIATPLTFWNMARSWRGAYEGWLPNTDSLFGHVKKTLPNLSHLYLAGQWVEPGGGVPMALVSGRHAVQLLCNDRGVPFTLPTIPAHTPPLPAATGTSIALAEPQP